VTKENIVKKNKQKDIEKSSRSTYALKKKKIRQFCWLLLLKGPLFCACRTGCKQLKVAAGARTDKIFSRLLIVGLVVNQASFV